MSVRGLSDIELLELLTGRKDMRADEMKMLMDALSELQRRNMERDKHRDQLAASIATMKVQKASGFDKAGRPDKEGPIKKVSD